MKSAAPDLSLRVSEELDVDLAAAVSIFRDSFPATVGAELGERASTCWMRILLSRRSSRLIVASSAGVLVGLAVLLDDADMTSVARETWILRCPGALLELAAIACRRPSWVIERCRRGLRRLLQRARNPRPAASSSSPDKSAAWLALIMVAPGARRKGVASRLLRQSLTIAAARGASTLNLRVAADNAPARRLYETFGFTPIGHINDNRIYARPIDPLTDIADG